MKEERRLRIAYDSFGATRAAIYAGSMDGQRCIYMENPAGRIKLATFEDESRFVEFVGLMQSLSQRSDLVLDYA